MISIIEIQNKGNAITFFSWIELNMKLIWDASNLI